jgi:hypothetical protein
MIKIGIDKVQNRTVRDIGIIEAVMTSSSGRKE